jgi:hypothetical protein
MAASKIAYLGMVSYFKAHIYMSIFHRGMKMLTKMSEHAYFTVERIYFANELFTVLHRSLTLMFTHYSYDLLSQG